MRAVSILTVHPEFPVQGSIGLHTIMVVIHGNVTELCKAGYKYTVFSVATYTLLISIDKIDQMYYEYNYQL